MDGVNKAEEWNLTVEILNQPVQFKLDTGAKST